MRRFLARLVLVLSLLFMPLSMATAPALASTAPAAKHGSMQHCPDQQSPHSSKSSIECAMACSAALPAADPAKPQRVIIVCTPVESRLTIDLHGIQPDTATPPPRNF